MIDNERGGYYLPIYNGEYHLTGIQIALMPSAYYDYDKMPVGSIQGVQGVFNLVELSPVGNLSGPTNLMHQHNFNVSEFLGFSAEEVTRGRTPLLITSGGLRVMMRQDYFYGGSQATRSQLINFGDDRYIHYYINRYARERVNNRIGFDECMFERIVYCVETSNGVCQDLGREFDASFPQNDAQRFAAAKYFFTQLGIKAPDLKRICNRGNWHIGYNDTAYDDLYRSTDGRILEGFLGDEDEGVYGVGTTEDQYVHNLNWRQTIRTMSSGGIDQSKIQIFQYRTDGSEIALRNALMSYLVFSGPNGFFGPYHTNGGVEEVNPAVYADMINALGRPTGEARHDQASVPATWALRDGYRRHWREMQGGIAFYNRGGSAWTAGSEILTPGRGYFDERGNPVTSISMGNNQGRFVTFATGRRTARVQINPRYQEQVITGKVRIDMASATSGASIRYTLDGSEPSASSTLYSGPFDLTRSAVVKAKAFSSGLLPSFVSQATYVVTDVMPMVGFQIVTDQGSEYLASTFALVTLSHPSGNTVSVNYTAPNGATTSDYSVTTGTLTFAPGEKFKKIRISIVNDSIAEASELVTLELTSATNAVIDNVQRRFTYQIIDNE